MKHFKPALILFLPLATLNANTGFGIGACQTVSSSYPAYAERSYDHWGEHHIGESYGGGMVFYVYDNGQHGLIAATADQNAGIPWYNGLTRYTGTDADGLGAGAKNTEVIVSKLIHDDEKGNFAAKACADYAVEKDGTVYKGWYLPSKFELNLLYQQKKLVGGFADTNYWSSTEYKSNSAWIQYFGNGLQHISNSEAYSNAIRAIRSF